MPQCRSVRAVDRKVAAPKNESNLRTKIESSKTRPSGWRRRTRMLIDLGLKKGPAVQVVPMAISQRWTTKKTSLKYSE